MGLRGVDRVPPLTWFPLSTLLGVTGFEAISPKPHKCSKERRFGHLAKIIINQSLNQFPIDEKYEYWKLRTDLR